MDKGKLLEEVTSQIRACLVSTKGKCDVQQIRRDYQMLMGSKIPYDKLGFKTLEDFVCSIPTLSTSRVNGQLVVDAKVSEKSSHMVSLIDKQKTTKRKTRPPPRSMYQNNFNGRSVPKWQPKSNKKPYRSSPRATVVSHNQFVTIPSPRKPAAVSKISSRLNFSRRDSEQQLNVKKEPEVVQTKSIERENSKGSLTSKARQRISQKMAKMTIEPNNDHLNGDSVTADDWITPDVFNGNARPHSDAIQQLQQESLAAVDLQNPVWKWSSSEDSPESLKNMKTKKPAAQMEFTGNHLVDLQQFVKFHNLGDLDIKTYTMKGKSRKPMLYCIIKVGNEKSSSYPQDCVDEASAQQAAARVLLNTLLAKQNKRQSLLISDDRDILERIPPIVELHYNGIWNWQIEADYTEKFGEQLPVNWLEIIDTLPMISVQPTLDKFVLRFCNPDEKGTAMPPVVANISVPSNTVKFNDDGSLLAEITCGTSAGEIWCRQLDTPEAEAFAILCKSLEDYYSKNSGCEQISKIDVGGYYVALYENTWCRVRVFDIISNSVHCFCIDYGDECVVPKSKVFQLRRQFAKDQAQAFVCRLAGVEDLYEASTASDYINSLGGKLVYVQLDTDSEEAMLSNPIDPALSVVLFDAETNVNINTDVISHIAIESATPTLNHNSPTEVYVTNALDDGSVYVQIRGRGYEQLSFLLENLEKLIQETQPESSNSSITPGNSKDKLYFTFFKDTWYRAKIVDWSPDNRYVQLLFVDYGTSDVVTLKVQPLYLLDDLSDTVSIFPYQALQVRMAINNIPADFVEKVKKLMPEDQPVLVKFIMNSPEIGPLVEFFKRSEKDNVLFSVNTSLNAETEFKNMGGGDGSNGATGQSTKLRRLISMNQFEDARNVPSSGSLSCPLLPRIGNYFDVRIPCAVHPHNFFVQPYDSKEKLLRLMAALQDRYRHINVSPILLEDIIPGKIYASKHEDGMWYRTSVIKVINSGSISVFYCDYGYYGNLNFNQLVPLDPEFMELPHQAIKAKLADIQPRNTKWSMDDCRRFEEMVCQKNFVSVLVAIEKDVLYRSDVVLSLKLIDTSTNVDVYIARLLIDEEIAVESNNAQEQ